jgi:hypothetical protein
MTLKDIARFRLYNQQVSYKQFKTPEEVVSHLGAIQAQDYLGSLWAIGLRLPNATEKDIEKSLAERKIVRTWPMRGTLHYVAPEDIRWMLKLMTPKVIKGTNSRYKQLGLDDSIFAKSEEIFIKALKGGGQLTRPELYKKLTESKISTKDSRGLHILGNLAMKGIICFGPRKGKQQTFVLLDEWVSKNPELAKEKSLAEIAKRYFTSHGPATLQDFVWWTGLTVADAKTGVELNKTYLTREVIEGQTYIFAKNLSTPANNSKNAYLLPFFDEYLVAYKDRRAALDSAFTKQINAGGGLLNPVIVIDGKVVGTWKRTLRKNSVEIGKYLLRALSKKEENLITDAEKLYTNFLGYKS